MYPTPPSQKKCFVYCGDDQCTCENHPRHTASLDIEFAPSTTPPGGGDLRAALIEAAAGALFAAHTGGSWATLVVRAKESPDNRMLAEALADYRRRAERVLAGPLATLTGALTAAEARVTRLADLNERAINMGMEAWLAARAESDRVEARARAAEGALAAAEAARTKLDADLRAAIIQVGEHARARGEAEEALRLSEAAGIVDGWRDRALAAEDARDEARQERDEARAEAAALHKDNERLRWRHPGVLPAWNDLPDGMRSRMVKTARSYDPGCGPEMALAMYVALAQAQESAHGR